MRKYFAQLAVISLISVFAACSTPNSESEPHPERIPSSAQEDDQETTSRLEESYQQIISSNQPAREMAQMVTRLSRIYFRATALVQQFDEEMEKSANSVVSGSDPDEAAMIKSDTYAQIQAAKFLMDRVESKILYYYQRVNEDRTKAMQAAKGKEVSSEAVRLTEIRKELNKVLREQSAGAGAFAMDDLLQKLFNQQTDFMVNIEASRAFGTGKSSDVESIRSRVITSLEKARELHDKYAAQIKTQMLEATADKTLNDEIKQEASVIQKDYSYQYSKDASDRAPAQSGKKIYPSASSAGNVIGGGFLPKTWVLTFDDGPHGTRSVEIMKMLEANSYKGTFFWLGNNLANTYAPSVVAYANAKGHELANHSQTHLNFGAVRSANMANAIQNEIIKPQTTMTKMYGYKPKFYRCPYGACTKVAAVRQALANQGYLHAFWAVDSLDWNKAANPNGASSIAKRVKNQMASVGRGVILFHDIHPQTVQTVKMLLPYFKSLEPSGHRVVSFCQAVDEGNGDPKGTFCSGH